LIRFLTTLDLDEAEAPLDEAPLDQAPRPTPYTLQPQDYTLDHTHKP